MSLKELLYLLLNGVDDHLSFIRCFHFSDMTLINQAIDTTRDLIACHDSDMRYDEVSCRSAVAALYLPIVGLVIGALQQLHGYGSEENSSITPDMAMAIATSSIMGVIATEENKGDIGSQVCG